MLFSRKPSPTHERNRYVGIDLTSSRVCGISASSGNTRPLVLDEQSEELPLFISLDRRIPEVGRAGYSLSRKIPHAVCSNFLQFVATTKEWRAGRNVLTPQQALELVFLKIRESVVAESDTAVLALPAYLAPVQVTRIV